MAGTVLLIFIIIVFISGAATLIGWHYWVQQLRDFKARKIRHRRAEEQRLQALRKAHQEKTRRKAATRRPVQPPPLPVPRRVPPPIQMQQAKTAVATSEKSNTYGSAGSLLTQGEQAFFAVLRQAVGNSYHITVKPRLADLVTVRQGKGFYSAFNKVAQKHIDFVLSDNVTMAIVLLVELDDKTHRQYRRRQRDKLVDSVCLQSGLKIVHIKARSNYQVAVLAKILQERITRP